MLIEFTDDKIEGVSCVETHEGSFLHRETEGPVRVQLGEGMAWGTPTAAPLPMERLLRRQLQWSIAEGQNVTGKLKTTHWF